MLTWASITSGTVALCAAAALIGFAAWYRPQARGLVGSARLLGWACLLLVGAVWLARWWAAGHLPLFGTYESSLSLAAAVLLAATMVPAGGSSPVGLRPVACTVCAAVLAHGLRFDPAIFPLTISERSWVVDVHALLAWAAFGTLAANAGLALLGLVRSAQSFPGIDRRLASTLSIGFALHSAMLASGSFYKFLLFGRAWSFDPIETLGLVAWVCYGTLLHLHLFSRWEGRRLAAWCLVLFLLLTATYRGIVYFPSWSTYHIFDMDLRLHVTGAGSPDPGGGP